MSDSENELGSELTNQELNISRGAEIDVGAGYPQLRHLPWLQEVLFDTSDLANVYASSPQFGPTEIASLNSDLLHETCRLLGIADSHAANAFVTFSGSAALDRVIESQLGHGRGIMSSSPSIDIIAGMISERSSVNAVFVPATEGFDVAVSELLSKVTNDTDCIILTSPENPTGNVISEAELAEICEFSRERGITLIVDQCFALIDPFSHDIPLLPNVAPPGLNWIFLWDTGKTFGLNEDKLGFIFCSATLRDGLRQRLNILQFDVSRRLKFLFKRIFREARENKYPDWLSKVVRENISYTERAVRGTSLGAVRPDAGSFLLLDTNRAPVTSREMADILLKSKGLGVIETNSFFHPTPRSSEGDRYLRLAMARDASVIREAVKRIVEVERFLASGT